MTLSPKPRFQRLLHESLIVAAYDCPTKTALITEQDKVTYERLLEHVQRCASALVARLQVPESNLEIPGSRRKNGLCTNILTHNRLYVSDDFAGGENSFVKMQRTSRLELRGRDGLDPQR